MTQETINKILTFRRFAGRTALEDNPREGKWLGRLRHRVVWAGATLATTLIFTLIPLAWPGYFAGQPIDAGPGYYATLQPTHKVFGAQDDPSFKLHFKDNARPLLSSLLGQASAASQIQTDVYYDNGRRVDIPVVLKSAGSSNFNIALRPNTPVKPGKYEVTVQWFSDGQARSLTQGFAWGVLSMNTVQAAYIPGQTVEVQMGVLSSGGTTICDAPLELAVAGPDGKTQSLAISRSDLCRGDSYSPVADYTASFVPKNIGAYRLTLKLADSDYQVSSEVKVASQLPFVIARSAPSRIYPYDAYNMNIQVTPSANFSGSVTESVPASFKLIDVGGGAVHQAGSEQYINWQADWQAGRSYTFSYRFKAPLVSPAFYYIGSLRLSSPGRLTYTEPRQWQIASDAVITLVQSANTSCGSSTSCTISFGSATTTGDALIGMMRVGTASAAVTVSSVSDSASNTWVIPSSALSQNPPAYYQSTALDYFVMVYALNTTSVTSVTIHLSGSAPVDLEMAEFSNVAGTSAVDQSAAQGDASSTSQSTPSVTTTNAADLLIGGIAGGTIDASLNNAGSTPSSGWTALYDYSTSPSSVFLGSAYQVMSATGTYSINFTLPTSKAAAGGIMAFKAGTSGGGGGGTCSNLGGGTANPIQYVQSVEKDSGGTSTNTLTATLPQASTAGDLLVVLLTQQGGSANAGQISSLTDSAHNGWVFSASFPASNPFAEAASGGNSYVAVGYAANAASATSVSVTFNASPTNPIGMVVAEFSGVATSSPVDQSAGTTSSTGMAYPVTPTITTTNANDLIIAALSSTSTPAISDSTTGYNDFSVAAGSGAFEMASAYKIVSSTGNYSFKWYQPSNDPTPSHPDGMGIIAFKQASGEAGGGAVDMSLLMRGGDYFCNGAEQGFFWASS